ncbi:tRNA uridine-5-carboxymethylaminomethyl(34) synthesis GTPase MnmE, partial [Klebsiella pneumoniae]|nr:tRNA uridine-5-carboxymethylaminomethyl(34) synthesis GTPase MnmE [Klebsiella pneumoniae]
RVSGDDAVEKVDRIFKGKDLTEVPSHTIHYGHIVDLDTNQVIEEVMVSIMRAPRTFTRENIVEINCHGGLVSVNKVLQLIL